MTLKYTKEAGKRSPTPRKKSIPGPATTLLVGGIPHTAKKVEGATMPPIKAPKAVKRGQASAAPAVHTLETKQESEAGYSSSQKLKENRLLCVETANTLAAMCDYEFESPLHKAADKIRNCSLAGAFRVLDANTNHKIGQALCRNRLCPNCQRVLAAKRRASFMDWMKMNEKPLTGFTFYHMVLTVRHSVAKKLRAGLYTGELLQAFAGLRGAGTAHDRNRAEWWDKRIAGGVFSVELAPGKADTSAHIHIHATLFVAPGAIPIYRKDRPSQFVKDATQLWRKLTNDPKAKQIFLEPVYTINEAGEKQPYQKGEPIDQLYKAVAECMKYTLKSDESSLTGYTPAFVQELLTTPNRYFGRFGVLSPKTVSPLIFCELERLNTNFQDLERMAAKELETLYNPVTGQTHKKEDTRIGITYFKNTRQKEAPFGRLEVPRGEKNKGGETYYQFIDRKKVGYLHPDAQKQALLYLARSIRAEYDPANDTAL